MRESNRGKLYNLCEEYNRNVLIRSELYFLDPQMECPLAVEKLERRLLKLEELMLNTLQEE